MTLADRMDAWTRILVVVALGGSAILFFPNPGDAFALPKMTLLALCAIAILGCWAIKTVATRELALARGVPAYAALGFAVGISIATALSTQPSQSVFGEFGQRAGALSYLAGVVLFFAVMAAFRPIDIRALLLAVVVGAVVAGGYAALQWRGIEPFDWSKVQVIGTMGNANFLAGWAGIAVPVCIVGALDAKLHRAWRVSAVVGAVLCALATYTARSFQGPVTLAAGVGVLAVVALAVHHRRLPRAAWVVGGVAVLLLAVALPVLGGDRIQAEVDNGLLERRYFWATAAEVAAEHPIVGTGPDTFVDEFLPRRSPEHVAVGGVNAGSAHDVPLELAAGGGLLAALPFVVFLGTIGFTLVQGLRRTSGERRLVLAGVGAGWVAYVVQSLVSMDRPHLLIMNWVLGGAIVVLAGDVPRRVWRLPGRPAASGNELHAAGAAAIAVIVVVGVGLGWVATRAQRADLAFAAGSDLLGEGDPNGAASNLERATTLAPWEAQYTFELVRLWTRTDQEELAMEAAERGARLSPGDSSFAITAAMTAQGYGETERARRWFDRAVEIDPHGLVPLLRAADAAAREGREERVDELLDHATEVLPGSSSVWLSVERIRRRVGDEDGAREARRRADEINPDPKQLPYGRIGL